MPTLDELVKCVGSLSCVVDIAVGFGVSVAGKKAEVGRRGGTGNRAGIELPEDHAGRLDEADGGMEGKKFAGRARGKDEGVVHCITIAFPIQGISRQLLELIGAVGRSWMKFLQLFIGVAILASDPKIALGDVDVFRGIVGRLTHYVQSRCGGRFGAFEQAAAELLTGPLFQHLGRAASPFGCGHVDVFPLWTEVQVYGGVISWGREIAFCYHKHLLKLLIDLCDALAFNRA